MGAIIDDMFYGSNSFSNCEFGAGTDYHDAANSAKKSRERLLAVLDEKQKELFEKYCGAKEAVTVIERRNAFSYAFKHGALLMIEVFSGLEEIS